MDTRRIQKSALSLALAGLVGLTGCDADMSLVSAGGTQVLSDPNAFDPSKVVCDPFQNQTNYPGLPPHLAAHFGVSGRISYLPASAPLPARVSDFDAYEVPVDTHLFMTDVGVPTRAFDLGFFDQNGGLVTNAEGTKLYEYFRLKLRGEIQLSADDPEGDYQFALLADDGATLRVDRGTGMELWVDNDGTHPTRFKQSALPLHLTHGSSVPFEIDYYQGPRYHIALELMWRRVPTIESGLSAVDPAQGTQGNSRFYDSTVTPSLPKVAYMDLLYRGWKRVSGDRFLLPRELRANPCIAANPPPPVDPIRVAASCQAGAFVPKGSPMGAGRVGLFMDAAEGTLPSVVSGLQAVGITPNVYDDAAVLARQPQADGVAVMILSRKAVFNPIDPAVATEVARWLSDGISVVAEYDGAAFFFDQFAGTQAIAVNLQTSHLGLFEGLVSGGGALLPISASTSYTIDSAHPITQGLPPNFLAGVRSAFAFSGYDSRWLSSPIEFTSAGFANLVPAGTYPGVLTGRCGSSRVVLFSMNYLQSLDQAPVQALTVNALNWSAGN